MENKERGRFGREEEGERKRVGGGRKVLGYENLSLWTDYAHPSPVQIPMDAECAGTITIM